MSRHLAAALTLAAALAPGAVSPAAAQGPAPPVLDCTSLVTRTTDEAALVKRFGRENVVTADIAGAEGSTERGTVVYPKDPTRRLEILWFDDKRRRRPSTVIVRDRSLWTVRAPGATGRAIAVGTSVGDVEEANERPFAINGFGWDMGGYGAGWKGGRLDHIEGGCSLSVRFDPDPKAKDAVLNKVSGEKPFGSSAPAIRAVRPTVSQLSLDWPE